MDSINEELLKVIAENAKKKAETLCTTVGTNLGKLITIEHHKQGGDFSMPRPFSPSSFGDTGELALASQAPSEPQIEIQPNDINMSDSVTYVWEIE